MKGVWRDVVLMERRSEVVGSAALAQFSDDFMDSREQPLQQHRENIFE
jgi:virulence-associated protein VagC